MLKLITTTAGFEPTHAKHNCLVDSRDNHSAMLPICFYRGLTRIELVTSRTQNENHTTRPKPLFLLSVF